MVVILSSGLTTVESNDTAESETEASSRSPAPSPAGPGISRGTVTTFAGARHAANLLHPLERHLRGRHRLLHILVRMRRAQERCFILGRRQVYTTIQHAPEELPKCFCIRLRRRVPIRDRPLLEEPRE